jgi:type II secretory ATPase GspE/PulE/Tfp pilus assembly ATPase PilB-like protein
MSFCPYFLEQNVFGVPGLKKQIEDSMGLDISVLLKTILSGSILLNASDLHLEALPDGSKLRCRIDGILQEILSFDKLKHQRIVSRIKIVVK